MAAQPAKPDYDDVVSQVHRICTSHSSIARTETLGQSVQGRDILALVMTDQQTPDDDKQHALIVASQHGAEESGRAMAMALADFLASDDPEAAAILKTHVVAVVACASPDGAQADSNRNADGVDLAHTYAFDKPALGLESQHLEQFADRFVPDVVVDIHGRAGGGMKELAWLMPAWKYSSDHYFLTAMSLAMAKAGEQAGFPQCEIHPPGSLQLRDTHDVMLGEKLAARYKTLALGLETIEHYYREQDWRITGLARLRRLLQFGMTDQFGLGVSGYPNALVSGNRIQGLMAHGRTAARRRENRVALTNFLASNFAYVDRDADGIDGCAKVRVMSKTCEGPNPDRFAVLLRFKKPCTVTQVTWQDQPLPAHPDHGYQMWDDHCSVFVRANLQAPFGGPERNLIVQYDCPYWND